jgi:hypothetical protein
VQQLDRETAALRGAGRVVEVAGEHEGFLGGEDGRSIEFAKNQERGGTLQDQRAPHSAPPIVPSSQIRNKLHQPNWHTKRTLFVFNQKTQNQTEVAKGKGTVIQIRNWER